MQADHLLATCEGKGTTYTELGVAIPLGDIPHLKDTAFAGIDVASSTMLDVKNWLEGSANEYASYTDWKVGLSKEFRPDYNTRRFLDTMPIHQNLDSRMRVKM